MDELTVAHVDPDVRVLLALLVEEQQVPAPQVCYANGRGSSSLFLSAARHSDARLPKAELDEAAAVRRTACNARFGLSRAAESDRGALAQAVLSPVFRFLAASYGSAACTKEWREGR